MRHERFREPLTYGQALTIFSLLHKEIRTMTTAIENLTANETALFGAVDQMLALLTSLQAQLDAAIAAGNQDAAIQAAADQLATETAKIKAALPAAPETPAA